MARIIDGKASNMVGDKVRELRMAKKMSQKLLSEKLETYAVYICRGPSPGLRKRGELSPI